MHIGLGKISFQMKFNLSWNLMKKTDILDQERKILVIAFHRQTKYD